MKSTGMVRRVDSLGRIVIPKEIRKVLKIKENEQVEINVFNDQIVLNRYSELGEYDIAIVNFINSVKEIYDKDILVTNLNSFVLTTFDFKKLLNLEISPYLNSILEERKEVFEWIPINLSLNSLNNEIKKSFIIKPIIKNGDMLGLIILLSEEKLEEADSKLSEFLMAFLDKYLE